MRNHDLPHAPKVRKAFRTQLMLKFNFPMPPFLNVDLVPFSANLQYVSKLRRYDGALERMLAIQSLDFHRYSFGEMLDPQIH